MDTRDLAWTIANDEKAWLQINAETRFQIGGQKLRPVENPVEKLCAPQDSDLDGSMHNLQTFNTPWGIILHCTHAGPDR